MTCEPADNDIILTIPEIYPVFTQVQKLQNYIFSEVYTIRCASDLVLFYKCLNGIEISEVISYESTFNRLDWLVHSEIRRLKLQNINRIFYDGLNNTSITFKKATFYNYLKYISGVLNNELKAYFLRRKMNISHLRVKNIFTCGIVQFNTGTIGYRFKIYYEKSVKPIRDFHNKFMKLENRSVLILMPLRNKYSKKQFWVYIIKMINENCFGSYHNIYIKQHPRCMDNFEENGSRTIILDRYLPLEFIDLNKANVVMHHSSARLNGTESIVNFSEISRLKQKEIFGNYEIFKNYILQDD